MISSVKKIKKDMDPDWLVLETTGVAYPNNIRKKLKEYTGIDAKICTVVDAKRWKRLLIPLHNLLEGQMEGADSVLINKINLVDEETVNNVAEDVRGLCNNEQVIVHKINALEPIEEEVWEGIL